MALKQSAKQSSSVSPSPLRGAMIGGAIGMVILAVIRLFNVGGMHPGSGLALFIAPLLYGLFGIGLGLFTAVCLSLMHKSLRLPLHFLVRFFVGTAVTFIGFKGLYYVLFLYGAGLASISSGDYVAAIITVGICIAIFSKARSS